MAEHAARVIFSTGSLHLMDISANFELAAETGFDGLELMCDQRWSTRDPQYITRLIRQYDIPVLAVHSPTVSTKLPGWNNREKGGDTPITRIERAVQLAEAVGAETVIVHLPQKIEAAFLNTPKRRVILPWGKPDDALKNWFERDLARFQDSTHIKLAVENLPAFPLFGRKLELTHWNDPESWGAVHTWLTMDTTHWATKGVDPVTAYRAAGKRLTHVHLSNYADGKEHRLPHTGELDLAALLRALAADGFDGTISVELYPEVLDFADSEALRRNMLDCAAFCREHLGQTVTTRG
jgi:sugar phosphate isomerase/epimerase